MIRDRVKGSGDAGNFPVKGGVRLCLVITAQDREVKVPAAVGAWVPVGLADGEAPAALWVVAWVAAPGAVVSGVSIATLGAAPVGVPGGATPLPAPGGVRFTDLPGMKPRP